MERLAQAPGSAEPQSARDGAEQGRPSTGKGFAGGSERELSAVSGPHRRAGLVVVSRRALGEGAELSLRLMKPPFPTWPCSSRPSTSFLHRPEDVDPRNKSGDDARRN